MAKSFKKSPEHIALEDKAYELFRECYDFSAPHFLKAEKLLNEYECTIDPKEWATLSDIYLPQLFIMVEQELPFLLEYLLPESNSFEFLPTEEALDSDLIRSAERYLDFVIHNQIGLRGKIVPTLKDLIRMEVGYGMVEEKFVTPLTRANKQIRADGETVVNEIDLVKDDPKRQLDYEHVPFGNVFPLGEGASPDTCRHCVIQYVTPRKLRQMEALDKKRVEEIEGYEKQFSVSADDIIDEARHNGLDASKFGYATVNSRLRGDTGNFQDHTRFLHNEAKVPIVKVFDDTEHTWLANGRHIIFHREDESGLRSDLIRFSACPDTDHWFPFGRAAAGAGVRRSANTLVNAIFDMMNYGLNPQRIVNTSALRDAHNVPRNQPHATYEAMGDPNKVVSFLSPPPLPGEAGQLFNIATDINSQVNGQPAALNGTGGAGLVRGGVNAFESLMQGPLGRQKFAGAIVEVMGLKPLYETLLIKSQGLMDTEVEFVVPMEGRKNDNDRSTEMLSIRPEDFRHVFSLRLNLAAKKRDSAMDTVNRLAIADRLINDPTTDQDALREYIVGDKTLADKLKASDEQIQQNLEMQQKQAEMQAGAQQQEQPQGLLEQGAAGIVANQQEAM